MKSWVIVAALMTAAAAQAQSRISIELGGAVSSYDLGLSATRGALSTDAAASVAQPHVPAGAIGVVELRPTVMLDRGLLVGVGFRDGSAGLGRGATNLLGGDVSVGYARKFGRFIPFASARFGFNTYDSLDGNLFVPKRTDLRLDAVLGTRLYVARRVYLSASGFAGLGDQYGGAIAVGGDVIQVFGRGVLP